MGVGAGIWQSVPHPTEQVPVGTGKKGEQRVGSGWRERVSEHR